MVNEATNGDFYRRASEESKEEIEKIVRGILEVGVDRTVIDVILDIGTNQPRKIEDVRADKMKEQYPPTEIIIPKKD
jgi:hypothetical protein